MGLSFLFAVRRFILVRKTGQGNQSSFYSALMNLLYSELQHFIMEKLDQLLKHLKIISNLFYIVEGLNERKRGASECFKTDIGSIGREVLKSFHSF